MLAKRLFLGVTNRTVVLHLICFGVLLFAFQAKLAIYKSSADPSVAGSKLSIEKSSSVALSAIGKREPTKAKHEFRLYILKVHSLSRYPLHMPVNHSARIALATSSKLDDQGTSYFHRPPPILL
jgi:hypothetical protein